MLYNTRYKAYLDGSTQFLHSERLMQVGVSKKKVGKGIVPREESVKVSVRRTVQEVYDIAKSNWWDWFLTLTFDPKLVDSFDYAACCDAVGNFARKLRRRDLKYILVPELHKSGAYHFHGLVQGAMNCLEPAVDPYSGKAMFDEAGRPVYNCRVYKAGWSTVTPVSDSGAASTYLTKYLSKELGQAVPKGKKRYWCSRGLERPFKGYMIVSPDDAEEMYLCARYRKDMDTPFGKFWLYEHRL